MKPCFKTFILSLLCMFAATPAFAHVGENVGGFESGFFHPWTGLDHLLAMFAVGVWGAIMGGAAVWKLPVTFPLVMVVGGVLGMTFGVDAVPGLELGVALASLVLGVCIALLWKPKDWIAMIPIAFFALLHGYAHGTELPEATSPTLYVSGFVVATGVIHVLGVFVGLGALRIPHSAMVSRAIGAAIAITGIWLCTPWLL